VVGLSLDPMGRSRSGKSTGVGCVESLMIGGWAGCEVKPADHELH
jgi:hypothetical protein